MSGAPACMDERGIAGRSGGCRTIRRCVRQACQDGVGQEYVT